MRTRRIGRTLLVAALALALLGACNDDDDEDTGSATNTTGATEEGRAAVAPMS